jgi:SPOR domain
MRYSITILSFFIMLGVQSQTITVVKDPRLDMLLRKQAELNKEVDKINNKTGPGYRIMVVNTNDRTKALEVKSRMMSDFPDEKSYLIYQSPYFKILIGNFRTRQEAEPFQKKILEIYPYRCDHCTCHRGVQA